MLLLLKVQKEMNKNPAIKDGFTDAFQVNYMVTVFACLNILYDPRIFNFYYNSGSKSLVSLQSLRLIGC